MQETDTVIKFEYLETEDMFYCLQFLGKLLPE